jgi:competence protein ComEC
MPFYDRSIDVLVATHPDEDHIGGLSDVLETYRVGIVFRTVAMAETGSYDAFSALSAAEPGGREVYAARGHVIDLGGGVLLRVLFPEVGVLGGESNAGSMVTQVIFGETRFLLTGDAPRAVETYLTARDQGTLASDVLKAGHHGSRTSSAETFVRMVDSTHVVISAGEDNSYGHPHQEVLDVFRSIGAEVMGTYERGTIVFESDGEEVVVR